MVTSPSPEPIPDAGAWPLGPPPGLPVSSDLKKRLWFTLGALTVYRLGTYIPLPGIDPQIIEDLFRQQQGGILGMFDLFSGGARWRLSIFALGVMPYITSAIIMELSTIPPTRPSPPAAGVKARPWAEGAWAESTRRRIPN